MSIFQRNDMLNSPEQTLKNIWTCYLWGERIHTIYQFQQFVFQFLHRKYYSHNLSEKKYSSEFLERIIDFCAVMMSTFAEIMNHYLLSNIKSNL